MLRHNKKRLSLENSSNNEFCPELTVRIINVANFLLLYKLYLVKNYLV
jgi:hypothetical protein